MAVDVQGDGPVLPGDRLIPAVTGAGCVRPEAEASGDPLG